MEIKLTESHVCPKCNKDTMISLDITDLEISIKWFILNIKQSISLDVDYDQSCGYNKVTVGK